MAYFSSPFYNKDFFNGSYFSLPFFSNSFFTGIGEQIPTGFADPTQSVITATGFTIDWIAPTGGDPVDNYIVSVETNIGSTPITGSPFTMAKSTLKKVVTGLSASTSYNVIVTARNGGGDAVSSQMIWSTTA